MKTKAPKEAKAAPLLTIRDKRHLPCRLTDSEKLERGSELARLHTELGVLENRRKEFNDQIKSQSAGVEARVSTVSQQINTGIEYRDVNCTWTLSDPDGDHKTLRRDDTNEILRIEEMSDEDRQTKLDFGEEDQA